MPVKATITAVAPQLSPVSSVDTQLLFPLTQADPVPGSSAPPDATTDDDSLFSVLGQPIFGTPEPQPPVVFQARPTPACTAHPSDPPHDDDARPTAATPYQPNMTDVLLEQIRIMQAANQKEFQRMEAQSRADRQAWEQALNDMASQIAINSRERAPRQPEQRPEVPPTPQPFRLPLPMPGTSGAFRPTQQTNASTGLPAISTTIGQPRRPAIPAPTRLLGPFAEAEQQVWHPIPAVQEAFPARSPGPGLGNRPAMQGPLPPKVTPEELQRAPCPVQRLRRDKASSTEAAEALQEIGYIADNKGKHPTSRYSDDVKWPEDYVDRLDGSEPTYENLTQGEFVAGFASIIEEDLPVMLETDKVRRNLYYLRGLMIDSSEVDWPTARAAHKHVLHSIIFGRAKWDDIHGCISAKKEAVQRITRMNNSAAAVAKAQPVEKSAMPCPMFQSLNCELPFEHSSDCNTYTHICAFCHRSGKKHPHAEVNCQKKQNNDARRPKNAKHRRKPQPE